jgi:FkbM family methyltransferase
MTDLPRLLKRLYRFRQNARSARRHSLSHWLLPRRKAALLAALRRDWPGAFALTDGRELVFVPAPLEARGEHLLFYGFDVPEAALRFAPAGGVVFDIGANLGEWAVPLAKAVGDGGRVLCCEPNPLCVAALETTLRINRLRHVRVLPVAISDANGEGHLAIDPVDSGQSHLAESGMGVPLCTLDSLVAEQALTRLDLVKIDVEGHEPAVLTGAQQTLQRFHPALIFESGHEGHGDRERIAGLLEQVDYELVMVFQPYGALRCTMRDYRAAAGPCAGREARNILALPFSR